MKNTKKPQSGRYEEMTERRCLKCRNIFLSDWVGKRICKSCKESHVWRTGDTPYDQ
jgi:hypothetical protein